VADSVIASAYGINSVISGNTLEAPPNNPGQTLISFVGGHQVLLSGTYSQSGNVLTVTITSHGFLDGAYIWLDFLTGSPSTPTSGLYTITSKIDNDNFTVTMPDSATTTGTLSMKYSTSGSTISNNTLRGGSIVAGGYAVDLSNNELINPGQYGYYISAADGITVTGGRIVNPQTGIAVVSSKKISLNNVTITGASVNAIKNQNLGGGDITSISAVKIYDSKRGIEDVSTAGIAGSLIIEGGIISLGSYSGADYAVYSHGTQYTEVSGLTILDHPGATAISTAREARISACKILRHTGTTGVNASGDYPFVARNNTLTFNRSTPGGTGIYTTGKTAGTILLDNLVYTDNANAVTYAIDTDASTNSKILNNIHVTGTIHNDATDTLVGNLSY